jgi:hypothetical protein
MCRNMALNNGRGMPPPCGMPGNNNGIPRTPGGQRGDRPGGLVQT